MSRLLDTNVVIAVLRRDRIVLARLRELAGDGVALSSLVLHELVYGALKGSRAESSVAALDALLVDVLPFDKEDAREAGQVRATLGALGTPIGLIDTLIAGQARARGLVLVTRNVREFGRVEGLRVENWEG